jgi:hypothetical protein
MSRRAISKSTETSVLLRSRRRCCICFGLNRDLRLKPGQIAHLNQKCDDNREDNLAYLCLEHHDEYDSSTRQRKGLTEQEVRAFRDELFARLSEYLSLPVHFGELQIPARDPNAGVWLRINSGADTAELALTPVGDSMEGYPRYAVTGLALWGAQRKFGPNLGDLAFLGTLYDGTIEHRASRLNDEPHILRMTFTNGRLHIDEQNEFGAYGMGVSFRGDYERAR